MQELKSIPIIDIFAGPGGLSEGFSSYKGKKFHYDIRLSIEKEASASKTLALRKFYKKFPEGKAPESYYDYLTGKITAEELSLKNKYEMESAGTETWQAELGSSDFPDILTDKKIKNALNGTNEWVLLGGPPCQAYSLVGRSRMMNTHPDFATDHRHLLYRQYLRIIKVHRPSIFIMENVKGILSSRHEGNLIFAKILDDLRYPWGKNKRNGDGYKIFSLSTPVSDADDLKPSDFIIRSENYGVPQARHRVILIGIRNDFHVDAPPVLKPAKQTVSVKDVILDLPKIRSRISRNGDSYKLWRESQKKLLNILKNDNIVDKELLNILAKALISEIPDSSGEAYIKSSSKPRQLADWLYDPRLKGVLNHEARSHMSSDLARYIYCSAFADLYGRSPKLNEFPSGIMPAHKNALDKTKTIDFSDRFRVQGYNNPSTTIVSHISKDGHYYIHPDPAQCRALTVREAARLQTFPDNYFFEGNRTQQYVQVGNAVPPYLAYQIAGIVEKVFMEQFSSNKNKVRLVG